MLSYLAISAFWSINFNYLCFKFSLNLTDIAYRSAALESDGVYGIMNNLILSDYLQILAAID